MNAEIVAVGSELLLGQIANTNAQFISARLAELGIDVYRHSVIGDNASRLAEELGEAEKRSDIVILTGGLGPTKDDLTKETVASHIGRPLVMDEPSLHAVTEFFRRAGRDMTPNNEKQALVIEGSTVFFNRHGMAPGMAVQSSGTTFILLPGPPREMKPMFLDDVAPFLTGGHSGDPVVSTVLRFFGIGEAELESRVEDLIEQQTNPTIAPLASDGEVTLRLTAKHADPEKAAELIAATEALIADRVGSFIYGRDDDSLTHVALRKLREHGKTIAVAESLTAGLFASELASVSGASDVLKGGVVCYTNESKEAFAGVSRDTLDTYGAVSEETAAALAEGIRLRMNASTGISFTGVAGPGELEGKPAGTVFIGLAIEGRETAVFSYRFSGERNYTRIRTVKNGLFQLIKALS